MVSGLFIFQFGISGIEICLTVYELSAVSGFWLLQGKIFDLINFFRLTLSMRQSLSMRQTYYL